MTLTGESTPADDRTFASSPIGSIVAFAGRIDDAHLLPERWRECNGESLNRLEFEELWNVLGESWGSGNGPQSFSLPDLRGLFLRGVSGNRTDSLRDPDVSSA